MHPSRRRELEKIAWERLRATAHNNGRWVYAWGGEGAVCFSYCPWSKFKDEDFDGAVHGLDLPWTAERLRQIESGEVDPDKLELRQWRVAKCRRAADAGEAWVAWVTPAVEPRRECQKFCVRDICEGGFGV